MIGNISLIGLPKDIENELFDLYDYDLLLNIATNYERVRDNIKLCLNNGITNIFDVIKYELPLLNMSTEKLTNCFKKDNIQELIKDVNEDHNNFIYLVK